MKNRTRFLGIIAIVAIIGFTFTACGGGGGGGGGGVNPPNISLAALDALIYANFFDSAPAGRITNNTELEALLSTIVSPIEGAFGTFQSSLESAFGALGTGNFQVSVALQGDIATLAGQGIVNPTGSARVTNSLIVGTNVGFDFTYDSGGNYLDGRTLGNLRLNLNYPYLEHVAQTHAYAFRTSTQAGRVILRFITAEDDYGSIQANYYVNIRVYGPTGTETTMPPLSLAGQAAYNFLNQ